MTALLEIALLLDCNLGMLPVVENGQIALLQIGPNCGRSSAPSIGRGLPQSSLPCVLRMSGPKMPSRNTAVAVLRFDGLRKKADEAAVSRHCVAI